MASFFLRIMASIRVTYPRIGQTWWSGNTAKQTVMARNKKFCNSLPPLRVWRDGRRPEWKTCCFGKHRTYDDTATDYTRPTGDDSSDVIVKSREVTVRDNSPRHRTCWRCISRVSSTSVSTTWQQLPDRLHQAKPSPHPYSSLPSILPPPPHQPPHQPHLSTSTVFNGEPATSTFTTTSSNCKIYL